MQALKSGIAIKAVVQLVGGSTSGFSKVAAEYWTIVVTTIVVSVICLASAIAAYVIRTDQRMRQDRHYGGAPGGADSLGGGVLGWGSCRAAPRQTFAPPLCIAHACFFLALVQETAG